MEKVSKKAQQFKGQKTYNHGEDSTFVLSAMMPDGSWKTILSRSRPGSRSKKVFPESDQVQHLKAGFLGNEKGFATVQGCIFAYVGYNQPGTTWQTAIWHFTPDTGWKSGPPQRLPSPKVSSWKFGPTGSTIYLHVRTDAGWLPKIWGWDRPSEQSSVQFPLEEQIKRLQVQMAAGGHDKCRFEPSSIIQAHIAYREGGSVKDAICHYSIEQGWVDGSKPYTAPDVPADLPQMVGKLWVADPQRSRTITANNEIRRQFQIFRGNFIENWPGAVDKYTDPNTAQLPDMAIEAFFWAWWAVSVKNSNPGISQARIYFPGKEYLLVRMSNGQPYCPKANSWPLPHFFYE